MAVAVHENKMKIMNLTDSNCSSAWFEEPRSGTSSSKATLKQVWDSAPDNFWVLERWIKCFHHALIFVHSVFKDKDNTNKEKGKEREKEKEKEKKRD